MLGPPILNFNGGGFSGVNPPDTVGDIGPVHYIQTINFGSGSEIRIYDKARDPGVGSHRHGLPGRARAVQ